VGNFVAAQQHSLLHCNTAGEGGNQGFARIGPEKAYCS
jgi:hypothetical protein